MSNTPEPLIPVNLDEYRSEIDKQGTALMSARRRLELTTEKLRLVVTAAVRAGLSESEAARIAGVRRQTVREWMGK